MRIGILSDVHGNLIGLDACISLFKKYQVDQIVCLGDHVGYIPDSGLAIEMLQAHDALSLLGNHDAMIIGKASVPKGKQDRFRYKETLECLKEKHLEYLSQQVPLRQEKVYRSNVLFVHGSPWDPLWEYVYPDSNLDRFLNLGYDFVFMGHTHRPFIKHLEHVTIVNVGSCGLPRDQGNLLSCVIFDSKKKQCTLHRIEIDTEELVRHYGSKVHPD